MRTWTPPRSAGSTLQLELDLAAGHLSRGARGARRPRRRRVERRWSRSPRRCPRAGCTGGGTRARCSAAARPAGDGAAGRRGCASAAARRSPSALDEASRRVSSGTWRVLEPAHDGRIGEAAADRGRAGRATPRRCRHAPRSRRLPPRSDARWSRVRGHRVASFAAPAVPVVAGADLGQELLDEAALALVVHGLADDARRRPRSASSATWPRPRRARARARRRCRPPPLAQLLDLGPRLGHVALAVLVGHALRPGEDLLRLAAASARTRQPLGRGLLALDARLVGVLAGPARSASAAPRGCRRCAGTRRDRR